MQPDVQIHLDGPIGGGADDWARVKAALLALTLVVAPGAFGEVVLGRGTWQAKTKQNFSDCSNTKLRGSGIDQTFIQCGYTPNPGGDDSNSPFWAVATGTGAASSTLSGDHAAGSTALTMASGTGFAAGQWVQLTVTGANGWSQLFRVKSVLGAVVTMTEPLPRAFTNGATAVVVSTLENFELSHMTILGTLAGVEKCDRAYEFITCYKVYVHDLKLLGSKDILGGIDIGCLECTQERIYADGLGKSAAILSMESARRCKTIDCEAMNPVTGSPGVIYMPQCDYCDLVRTRVSGSDGVGVFIANNSNAAVLGCQGCRVIGGEIFAVQHGIHVTDGSTDTEIHAVDIHDTTTGSGILLSNLGSGATPSARTKIFGGSLKRCATYGIYATGGSVGNACFGTAATNGHDKAFFVDGAAELACNDNDVLDEAITGASGLNLYGVSGAGSLLKLRDCKGKSTNVNVAALIGGVSVASGGRVEIDGFFFDRPNSANATSVGVNLVSGYCSASRMRVTGSASAFNPAFYLADATCTLAFDPIGCDFSTASTAFYIGAAGVHIDQKPGGYATIAMPNAAHTLTNAECFASTLDLTTGAILGPQNLIVPHRRGLLLAVNNQSAQTVTVIGATGTGIAIVAGAKAIVYSDETNVLKVA